MTLRSLTVSFCTLSQIIGYPIWIEPVASQLLPFLETQALDVAERMRNAQQRPDGRELGFISWSIDQRDHPRYPNHPAAGCVVLPPFLRCVNECRFRQHHMETAIVRWVDVHGFAGRMLPPLSPVAAIKVAPFPQVHNSDDEPRPRYSGRCRVRALFRVARRPSGNLNWSCSVLPSDLSACTLAKNALENTYGASRITAGPFIRQLSDDRNELISYTCTAG